MWNFVAPIQDLVGNRWVRSYNPQMSLGPLIAQAPDRSTTRTTLMAAQRLCLAACNDVL